MVSVVIRKVTHYFNGFKALDNVNVKFNEPGLIGLLGPNGAGKTTLMKIIAGLLTPSKGEVLINGEKVHKIKVGERSRIVTYATPFINLSMNITVADFLIMGRYPWVKTRLTTNDLRILENYVNLFNLSNLLNRYLYEISSGELSRVIIAKALSQETDVVLLDELISFLDLGHQIQVLKTLRKLVKKKLVIISTHILIPTLNYVDKVLLLKNGKVLGFGNPQEDVGDNELSKLYGVKLRLIRDKNLLLEIIE